MERGSRGKSLLVCSPASPQSSPSPAASAEASSPGEAPRASADPHLLLTCKTVSVPALQVCSVRGTQGGSSRSDEQGLF